MDDPLFVSLQDTFAGVDDVERAKPAVRDRVLHELR